MLTSMRHARRTPDCSIRVAVAEIVDCTQAEGPGRRMAIWFQGCPFRCPGCCNQEFLPAPVFGPADGPAPDGKYTIMPLQSVFDRITAAWDTHDIEGITLLGGEPLWSPHLEATARIAEYAQSLGLTVMIFTGYDLPALLRFRENWTKQAELPGMYTAECSNALIWRVLGNTDLLVDGKYDATKPDTARRWVGSTNQTVYCLTTAYSVNDDYWKQPNTVELRLVDGAVVMNGFPTPKVLATPLS